MLVNVIYYGFVCVCYSEVSLTLTTQEQKQKCFLKHILHMYIHRVYVPPLFLYIILKNFAPFSKFNLKIPKGTQNFGYL